MKTQTVHDLNNIIRIVNQIDEILKNKAGKPFTLLDLLHNQKTSPLDALIHNERYFELTNLFPNMLWSSLFLTSYSIIEKFLYDICNSFATHHSIELKPNDLAGKGIVRSKNYLIKVMKFQFFEGSPNWMITKNGNYIRNLLMHSSGVVDVDENKHKKVKNMIRDNPSLDIIDHHIVLSKDYVLLFLSSCIGLVEEIIGLYEKHITHNQPNAK
ncbi:MAG: hypothetical protein ISS29_01925 [Candidatus Marinimicrobia bacterium]|nr:hypothetical protein [Candidatus Neomarinimicrobiota bacterium]